LNKKRNSVQKEVGVKKKAGQECDDQVLEIKNIGETLLLKEAEKKSLQASRDKVDCV
jgi:hypothetical protein